MSNPENRMWLLDQMENFFSNEDYEKPAGFKPLD
jgi:Fe-S cluster biosynthesis and repair protein YggX